MISIPQPHTVHRQPCSPVHRVPCTAYRVPCTVYRFPRTSGFTLFELMIVMVIIGLISALVIPRVGGNLDTLKLKAETKKVAAAMRYARSRAVSENMTLRVSFDIEKGVVSVSTDAEKSEDDFPWRRSVSEEDEKVVLYQLSLVEGVELFFPDETGSPEESNEIVFYPSGGCTGGDVFLKTGEKMQYRLMVDEISGTVKVLEYNENVVG